MNRPRTIVSFILALTLAAVALAAELKPAELRKLTQQERSQDGFKGDSVGTPVKVVGVGEKKKDFWLIPVFQGGKLAAVYRDDPRRESVTEVAKATALRFCRADLFEASSAAQELTRAGVENPQPVLISCGPLSAFGATNTGWYQRVGESFVLLSLGGKLISESEVEQFWPEYLPVLRAFRP